ncbi:MAG: (2Fe-2S)-binding protein [Planctomycetota bacterium]|nr:(2Fe-2S)-binding protein [Planctomycetota bacterium]
MDADDHVCLCFHVSLRKLTTFMKRERPSVPSRLSECLGAGTGCQWCVPFLEELHRRWAAGEAIDLSLSPEDYARRRARFHETGRREDAGG